MITQDHLSAFHYLIFQKQFIEDIATSGGKLKKNE